MALTDKQCQAKARQALEKRSDGGGLQLWVDPKGSRLWRLAYRFGGKQKLLALGSYPVISLAEARERRTEAKKLLAAGVDPGAARRLAKLKAKSAATFDVAAAEYLAKLEREGRRASTLSKARWLLGFASPTLGDRALDDILPADVLSVLKPVELRGRLESARRMREVVGSVFRLAVAQGKATNDPTVALRGALAMPTHTPRAAIVDPRGVGALMRAIDGFEGQPTTKAALRLMALLFPRPGELRGANWSEFDLETAVWTIPAARTKLRREHKVPLAQQCLAILDDLQKHSGKGALILPSLRKSTTPLSETTMNAALRRLGYGPTEATAHGFRATASTLLNESGLWSSDAIERQLAHLDKSAVRRAYARSDHWDERVRMMQWWADHLDGLKTTIRPFARQIRNANG
jgi:integrase